MRQRQQWVWRGWALITQAVPQRGRRPDRRGATMMHTPTQARRVDPHEDVPLHHAAILVRGQTTTSAIVPKSTGPSPSETGPDRKVPRAH